MKAMNGLDLQSQPLTNVADPSNATDGANKQYVDNVARGLFWKQPVRVATTTNGALATAFANGQSVDGVTLVTGNRILLKSQTTAAENGIYVVNSSGAPTRALDADGGTELNPGTAVTVLEGTTNADKVFLITSDASVTVGTTSQVWGQLGGGSGTTYTAGNGLGLSGTVFSGVAKANGGLTVDSTGFYIDTSIVPRKLSGTMGNGSLTTIAVTHNLGTKDVVVSVRIAATDETVIADWVATDTNTVTFTFGTAPSASSIRWTVIG